VGSSTQYKPNYFLKDFDTLRTDLITRVPIISQGKLTDLNESSVTVTLIELFATMGDMLGFYLNSNALEAFLPTVRQPENVYRHAKTIGYKIREATSAQAWVRFSTLRPLSYQLTIPRGTRIGTAAGGGISSQGLFITQDPIWIVAGDLVSAPVLCKQGVPYTDQFKSEGTTSQKFKLSTVDVDPTTIEVFIGSSPKSESIWVQVTSFLYSTREDTVFVSETDYLGVTRVIFGDGKYGKIPDINEEVTIKYLQSAGIAGNVNAGAISLVLSKIDHNGQEIDPELLSVTNEDPSEGGGDKQSLEQVKSNAPGSLSALYRAMTKYDYIALIQRLGGIQHVNAWGEQEEVPNNDNWEEYMNWVNVVLAPVGTGGRLPDSTLEKDVREYLLSVQPITVRLRFIPPEYRTFNISVTIGVFSNYSIESIRLQAQKEINDYLAYENVRFGLDLRTSSVYSIVMNIPGVSHASVDDFVEVKLGISEEDAIVGQEAILNKWEIPLLGSVTLTMEQAVEKPTPDLYPYTL